jgi:hypothetical protein
VFPVVVSKDAVVVASVVVPVVTNAVAVAEPRREDPELIEVNVGVGDTAIVEVEERTILDPAMM